MPANLTEGSPGPEAPGATPDSHAAACFPTPPPDVVGDGEWGSFYRSFKVSVLPSFGDTGFNARDG